MLMDYHIPAISLQICEGDRLKAGSNHIITITFLRAFPKERDKVKFF